MAFPTYKTLENLTKISEVEEEILVLQKSLFDLKMKRSTNQSIKSHLFVHTKRRIAQLNFKKRILENSQKE
jgi:ribosomal protein L29